MVRSTGNSPIRMPSTMASENRLSALGGDDDASGMSKTTQRSKISKNSGGGQVGNHQFTYTFVTQKLGYNPVEQTSSSQKILTVQVEFKVNDLSPSMTIGRLECYNNPIDDLKFVHPAINHLHDIWTCVQQSSKSAPKITCSKTLHILTGADLIALNWSTNMFKSHFVYSFDSKTGTIQILLKIDLSPFYNSLHFKSKFWLFITQHKKVKIKLLSHFWYRQKDDTTEIITWIGWFYNKLADTNIDIPFEEARIRQEIIQFLQDNILKLSDDMKYLVDEMNFGHKRGSLLSGSQYGCISVQAGKEEKESSYACSTIVSILS